MEVTNDTERKLRDYFSEMVVYKDQNSSFLASLGLPSFMRDWLLQRFEDEDGSYDPHVISQFTKQFIPKQEDWESIKARIIKEDETVKMLTKITVHINVKTGEATFALPDLGLSEKDTIIEDYVWNQYSDQLTNGQEVWGMIELGYRPPEEHPVKPGKIKLLKFQNFCPYEIDLEYYKRARAYFTTEEWIDVLLSAVDYNPAGYINNEQKLYMLQRLLPFVEKRLNLIELAPKGTGKSYLYGRVSRYGWLSSGGTMSRAKMFYDVGKHQEGLIASHDFVTLDEVQTISFTDTEEMRAALKGYLESGTYTVMNHEGQADAGLILCGNIPQDTMKQECTVNMFETLPEIFHESALIDRFHGFIKGWEIPRMRNDLKFSGWALNSEYFCSILHELRSDVSYRAIVDELVVVQGPADTRDTEAVLRITTAFLKLLFPQVQSAGDISTYDFQRYCLTPARKMRKIILTQLGIMDREYAGKSMPKLTLRQHT